MRAASRCRRGADRLVPANGHRAVARAICAEPRETLGLELAQAMPLESTGLWGFLLRSSPTFGDMLHRAERYMRLANRYAEFTLEDRGERIALVCRHPDPSPYGRREQVVMVFLGHWVAWGRKLSDDEVVVDEARLRWQGPKNSAPFEAFFKGHVHFGADEDALVIDKARLDIPLRDSTPELGKQFEAYAAALIQRMAPGRDFAEAVRTVLADGLLTGMTREADVAARLAVTPRTLPRRLVAANTSFREIRDVLLRQRAEALLREQRLPIAEVAYLLGYAEVSSFHRAFRRWTSFTPAVWRALLQ